MFQRVKVVKALSNPTSPLVDSRQSSSNHEQQETAPGCTCGHHIAPTARNYSTMPHLASERGRTGIMKNFNSSENTYGSLMRTSAGTEQAYGTLLKTGPITEQTYGGLLKTSSNNNQNNNHYDSAKTGNVSEQSRSSLLSATNVTCVKEPVDPESRLSVSHRDLGYCTQSSGTCSLPMSRVNSTNNRREIDMECDESSREKIANAKSVPNSICEPPSYDTVMQETSSINKSELPKTLVSTSFLLMLKMY